MTTLTLFTLNGALFLGLKTTGDLRRRAQRPLAWRSASSPSSPGPASWPGPRPATAAPATWPPGSPRWCCAAVAAVTLIGGVLGQPGAGARATRSPPWPRPSSAATAALFTALFPDVLRSSTSPAYTLTIGNASSTAKTLALMTVVACIFLPLRPAVPGLDVLGVPQADQCPRQPAARRRGRRSPARHRRRAPLGPAAPHRTRNLKARAHNGSAVKPLDPRLLRHARQAAVYIAVLVALGTAAAGLIIAQAQLLSGAIAGAVDHGATLSALRGIADRAGRRAGRPRADRVGDARPRPTGPARRSSPSCAAGARRAPPRSAPRWLAGRRSAELTALATEGIDALDGYFSRYLPQLILAAIVPVAVLVRVGAADLLSGVTIAGHAAAVPLFGALVGHGHRRLRPAALAGPGRALPPLPGRGHRAADPRCSAGRGSSGASIGQVTGEYRSATMAHAAAGVPVLPGAGAGRHHVGRARRGRASASASSTATWTCAPACSC